MGRRACLVLPALLLCTAATAAEVSENWLARVQRDIAGAEYHATWRPDARAYDAPNREQLRNAIWRGFTTFGM